MGTPYIGEIRIFAGNFAPSGWLFCEGQLLQIADNDALFNLIGTTYGGDGTTTFALPDLRGRIPIHVGQGHGLSEAAGVESVTLLVAQMPAHSHALQASQDPADPTSGPDGGVTGDAGSANPIYGSAAPGTSLHASAVAASGGAQPHENLAPYLCVNFIISLFGIFPSQG